jgi:hypothetical protein
MLRAALAGGRGALGELHARGARRGRRGGHWGGCGRRGSAKMPFESPIRPAKGLVFLTHFAPVGVNRGLKEFS